MKKVLIPAVLGLVLATGACDRVNQAMTAHTGVVARAAGHELSVDAAAEMIARNPRLPAQREVVDAVANLWLDYTLLATAASRDSLLAAVDLDPVVRPRIEQELVYRLRDEVIQVDTAVSEEELQRIYEEEQPNLEIRARHILLRVPIDAESAERDSVLAAARELRERAAAGEDFAALARRYSEDPGSAEDGGDLGFFTRGQMLEPFEEAAFALDVGEVSEVVETPVGYHVITVAERRMPEFDEVRDSFREQLVMERQLEAQDAFVGGLTDSLDLAVEEGAYEVARKLSDDPGQELSGRARSRALVRYRGGTLTAGEYRDHMRRFPPNARARYAMADSVQLARELEAMAINEILVAEARRRVGELTPAQRDSLREEARAQLRETVRAIGFAEIQPREGETRADAVTRVVRGVVESVVDGSTGVLQLGTLAYSLRDQYRAEIFERSFPAVLERLQAVQPGGTGLGAPAGADAPTEPGDASTDSAGEPSQPQPDDAGA